MFYRQLSFKLCILLLGFVSGDLYAYTKDHILSASAFISGVLPDLRQNYHTARGHASISRRFAPIHLAARCFRTYSHLRMASKDGSASIKSQQLAARLKTLKVGELRLLFDQVQPLLYRYRLNHMVPLK
jgi:hypothetical protein